MQTLALVTPNAALVITPAIGGAIVAFTVRGVPILRPTAPDALARGDVRDTACYPLVPYSNRIRDAALQFAGRRYALARNFGDSPHAIHGVGWQRAWRVAESSTDRARLALDHDARGDEARAWPWPFHATLAYHLTESDDAVILIATLAIRNVSDAAFPFGLGFHPFFPRLATTRLGFVADSVWLNDATQLPCEKVPIPTAWRFDPPKALDGVVLDNVFAGFRGTATIDDDAVQRRIDADRALAFAVVYAPAGRDFVAVEPVSHETDAFNRATAGARGTGMRVLQPNEAFSCTMRVAARLPVPAAR